MKLGPIHILKDATWRHHELLLRDMTEQRDRLAAEIHRDGFPPILMHSPTKATVPPPAFAEADPPGPAADEAVARVVAAYRKAMAEHRPAAPGMWDDIEERSRGFVKALADGDERTVGESLRQLFRTDLPSGLGTLFGFYDKELRKDGLDAMLLRMFTDALVSLGEAVGVQRVTSIEQQGVAKHLAALSVDLDDLGRRIEARTGLSLAFPEVAGAFGGRLNGKLTAVDTLWHTQPVWRLRQLGATADWDIIEIGGGFGCLALLFFRAGHRRYKIIDLPWVNALQGYFLIRALPPGSVRLFGEPESAGTLEILPHWRFAGLPDRSADAVINSNSMPEMGEATARAYVRDIRRIARRLFLSINQEAGVQYGDIGRQGWVREFVESEGGYRCLSRNRWWMRQGYVEEVFEPIAG